MLNRRQFLGSFAAGAMLAPAQANRRPNIVVMMADDMGFSDLGCYGSEIRTPHLDSLAKAGLRFTQFYNGARCCPTRASLMTGLYPHQAGVGHMVDTAKQSLPGYRGDLNESCVTIAQVMRTAGYRTMMTGKWHVTPVSPDKKNWPLQRGFERYYGTITGAGSFYDPATLTLGNDPAQPDGPEYYYTDAIATHAEKFLGELGQGPDPFFMYVAFTAPSMSEYRPDMSVMMPILITSPEIWAWAGVETPNSVAVASAQAAVMVFSFMAISVEQWSVKRGKSGEPGAQTPRYSCRLSRRAGSSAWLNCWITWPCSITRKRSASGAAKRKFCSTITMV